MDLVGDKYNLDESLKTGEKWVSPVTTPQQTQPKGNDKTVPLSDQSDGKVADSSKGATASGQNIQPSWETVRLRIKYKSADGSTHAVGGELFSKKLDPRKMQFALLHRLDSLKKLISCYDIKWTDNLMTIILNIIEEEKKIKSSIANYEDDLEDFLSEFTVAEIDCREFESMSDDVQKVLSENISAHELDCYKHQDKILLVGNKKKVRPLHKTMTEELEMKSTDRTKIEKPYNFREDYEVLAFQNFGFGKKLKEICPSVEISLDAQNQIVIFVGHPPHVEMAHDELKKLLDCTYLFEHVFDREYVDLLNRREAVDTVTDMLKKKNIRCLFVKRNDHSKIYTISLSEKNNQDALHNEIKCCLTKKTFSNDFLDYVDDVIKQYDGKNLLIYKGEMESIAFGTSDTVQLLSEREMRFLKQTDRFSNANEAGKEAGILDPFKQNSEHKKIPEVRYSIEQETQKKTESANTKVEIQVHISQKDIDSLKKRQFEEQLHKISPEANCLYTNKCLVSLKCNENELQSCLGMMIQVLGYSHYADSKTLEKACADCIQRKEMIQKYIQERLRNAHKEYPWFEKDDQIHVHADSDRNACDTIHIIQNAVICNPLENEYMEEVINHREVNDIVRCNEDKAEILHWNGSFFLVGTDDAVVDIKEKIAEVFNKLSKESRKYTRNLTEEQANFIQLKYGDKIRQLQKQTETNIQLDKMRVLSIEGDPGAIKKAKSFFDERLDNFKIYHLTVETPDVIKVLESESASDYLQQIGGHKTLVEVEKVVMDPLYLKCWINHQKNPTKEVYVVQIQGNATSMKADVLLCPVNTSAFGIGDGEHILEEVGAHGYNEYIGHITSLKTHPEPGHVFFSETAETAMPCPQIAFASFLDNTTKIQLKQDMEKIIYTIDVTGFNSIAIPLKITGCLAISDLASLLTSLIEEKMHQFKNLSEIFLCGKDVDETTVLGRQLSETFKTYLSLDFTLLYPRLKGNAVASDKTEVMVKVEKGSITAQKVDVLVNTVGRGLNFSKGYLSREILQRAGKIVEDECKTQYPDGLPFGHIALTSAGNMAQQCDMICHGALIDWILVPGFSLRVLKLLVMNCLHAANDKGYSSIAFPALGTGYLKYPWQLVAKTMFDCVKEYRHSSLKLVKFVIHDRESLEAFEREEAQRKEPVAYNLDMGNVREYFECVIKTSYGRVVTEFVPLSYSSLSHGCEAVVWFLTDNSKVKQGSRLQRDGNKVEWSKNGKCWQIYQWTDESYPLSSGVSKCLEIGCEKRLVSMAFILLTDDSKVKTKAKEQASEIRNAVWEFYKDRRDAKGEAPYFELIRICLIDEELFTKILENTKTKRQEKLSASKKVLNIVKKTLKATTSDLGNILSWRILKTKVAAKKGKVLQIIGDDPKEIEDTITKINNGVQFQTSVSTDQVLMETATGKHENLSLSTKHDNGEMNKDKLKGLTSISCAAGSSHGLKNKENEVSPGLNVTKKNNILSKVCAEINTAILNKMDGTTSKQLCKDLEIKFNVKIVCNTPECLKLEVSSLDDIKKVNQYLEDKYKGDKGDIEDETKQMSGDNGSDDSFANIDTVKMSKRDYDVLMHFWGNELKKKYKVDIEFDENLIVCFHDHGHPLSNKTVIEEIERNMQMMNTFTTTEIAFKREELGKVESIRKSLRSEYKDVFFSIEKEKSILYAVGDYSYEQRQAITHKINLLLGHIQETKTRRHRRFGAGHDIEVIPNENQPEPDYKSLPSSFSSQDHSRSSRNQGNINYDGKKKFTTSEGIDVYVYSANILKLNVDCIVNAANEHLSHGAGVAAVIARAAGYELEQECRNYIKDNGPIPVGTCCHTTAGNLSYKFVIHTVGPRWDNYMTQREQEQCKVDLQNAIKSCFYKADILGMSSIGVPSVSAGIFGMPGYLCAQQYCKAVVNYSQQKMWGSGHTTLKEIHFIDRDAGMCNQIELAFSKCDDLNQAGATMSNALVQSHHKKSGRHSFSSSSKSYDPSTYESHERKNSFSKSDSSAEGSEYYPCNWLRVHLLEEHITTMRDVDAVVSPEVEDFTYQGSISGAILEMGDKSYKEKYGNLKKRHSRISDVFALKFSGGMDWKYVFHAITPCLETIDHQFKETLKKLVESVLDKAEKSGVESLAIPLLGVAGPTSSQETIRKCCQCTVDAIQEFCRTQSSVLSLKEIHIVLGSNAAFSALQYELDNRFGKHSKTAASGKTDSGSWNEEGKQTEVDEHSNCCICMDTLTNPKRLPCGHVFCTDCIDQSFSYKPACPQCGKVFGKLTGDQPPGTIKIKKNPYVHLAGYEQYGEIEVCYNIPGGRQGTEHPNPGKWYDGIYRSGHLPDNEKGNLVAKLLRVAFDRRLVFTIGSSRTTGAEGVVTWNDIHHKTRLEGGPARFGYPDETYLDRVLDELAAKGVTKDSLKEV